MKVVAKAYLCIFLILSLSACTAGQNPLQGKPDKNGNVAGFFNGWWDGCISGVTLIVSFFNPEVGVYNPHSDKWYPLGFLIGAGSFAGSSVSASKRKK